MMILIDGFDAEDEFENSAEFGAKSAISQGRWIIRSHLPGVPLKKKKVRY
jgi:hypothetical protein